MMSNEIWKPIPGYEYEYMVSSLGRIKSIDRMVNNPIYGKVKSIGKILKQRKMYAGYMTVCLSKHGHAKTFRVHRIVCLAFHPNKEGKPNVNHINGIRDDNRIENLEWCTQRENVRHTYDVLKKKTIRFGGVDPYRCKPVVQISKCGLIVKEYMGAYITRHEGFNHRHVSECCNGKRKSHAGFFWKFKKENK